MIDKFITLKDIRHESVHYNANLYLNLKKKSFESIKLIFSILDYLFSPFGNRPWYIEGTLGACYIKKEYEESPFVKKLIIPHCIYVGYKHKIINVQNWTFEDNFDYPDKIITDEEYRDLINSATSKK